MKKETYALNHPAFPNNSIGNPDWDGMTLRDYFAAKAMQAVITSLFAGSNEIAKERKMEVTDVMAFSAYEFADAMLKARQL